MNFEAEGIMLRENCRRIPRGCEPGVPTTSDLASQLLSVIIPARDEVNSIGSLILKIGDSLSGYPHQIIVVDDGSGDGTREMAQSNGAIVISHDKNLGKGAAMKTGVQNASGGVIIFFDGDGAHDAQDILRVIAPILERKADFIIGSRALPESKVITSPLTRRLSNNLASFAISVIISFLLPLATLFRCPVKYTRITDCTSGFRAISRESWRKLILVSQGFEIETEMIYEAAKNKLAISEVPISCNWNSHLSRLAIFRDGFGTLKLLAGKLIDEVRK
ncbi:MAG: glycosyltransferase family 2 protein [Dehalococcoidia bacterium]